MNLFDHETARAKDFIKMCPLVKLLKRLFSQPTESVKAVGIILKADSIFNLRTLNSTST